MKHRPTFGESSRRQRRLSVFLLAAGIQKSVNQGLLDKQCFIKSTTTSAASKRKHASFGRFSNRRSCFSKPAHSGQSFWLSTEFIVRPLLEPAIGADVIRSSQLKMLFLRVAARPVSSAHSIGVGSKRRSPTSTERSWSFFTILDYLRRTGAPSLRVAPALDAFFGAVPTEGLRRNP
jgi:hypothetical protein